MYAAKYLTIDLLNIGVNIIHTENVDLYYPYNASQANQNCNISVHNVNVLHTYPLNYKVIVMYDLPIHTILPTICRQRHLTDYKNKSHNTDPVSFQEFNFDHKSITFSFKCPSHKRQALLQLPLRVFLILVTNNLQKFSYYITNHIHLKRHIDVKRKNLET